MNEHALRQLVRQAVARHLGAHTVETPFASTHPPINSPTHQPIDPPTHQPINSPTHQPINSPAHQPIHASHALYPGLVNVTDACVIEPAVPCDHCGYCKSHGH